MSEPNTITCDVPPKIPELRELGYFRCAARVGNFGRAARELQVSQSKVSRVIQRLEERFGKPLLVRHGHGVTLTNAGSSLLDRLDIIMHLLGLPLDEGQAAEAAIVMHTLGVTPEVSALLIPALVERTYRHQPDLRFTVLEATSAKLEELLLSYRLDMAVLQDPPVLKAIRIEPILSDPLGLVINARSPLASVVGPLHMGRLAELPLLLPGPMHSIHRKLTGAGYQRGRHFQAMMQVDSVSLAKEMVRKGLGCTVLPSIAMQDESAAGEMVFIPLEKPNLSIVHAFAYRYDATRSHVLDFAREVRLLFTEHVSSWTWCKATLIPPGADGLSVTVGSS